MDLAVCTVMIQTLGPGRRNQFSPGLQGSCQTEIIERSMFLPTPEPWRIKALTNLGRQHGSYYQWHFNCPALVHVRRKSAKKESKDIGVQ
jgi:hypothetical protein